MTGWYWSNKPVIFFKTHPGLQLERRQRRDVAAVRGDGGDGGQRPRVRRRVPEVQRDVRLPDRAGPLRDEDGRVQVSYQWMMKIH